MWNNGFFFCANDNSGTKINAFVENGIYFI